MKRYFKVFISLAVLALAAAPAFSQQITKFGVVDTAKVYNAYFRNSAPVRNYEKKRSEFQAEINKQTEELQRLQSRKVEYEKAGNEIQAQKIQAEITKKTDFLTVIHKVA
jgi:outer membrane protein